MGSAAVREPLAPAPDATMGAMTMAGGAPVQSAVQAGAAGAGSLAEVSAPAAAVTPAAVPGPVGGAGAAPGAGGGAGAPAGAERAAAAAASSSGGHRYLETGPGQASAAEVAERRAGHLSSAERKLLRQHVEDAAREDYKR